MARRFLQQRIAFNFTKASLLPVEQCLSNRSAYKLSKSIIISSRSHQTITSKTNSTSPTIDFDDLFSSSDDDSDLSDLSDNESNYKDTHKNKDNNTPQKQQFKIPKYESNRVIISNLSDNANTTDLNDLCSQYGHITDLYLPINRNDPLKHRGFVYVSFETKEQSKKAIPNINGSMLHNKILRAGYAKPLETKQHNKKHIEKQNRSLLDLKSDTINTDTRNGLALKETTINISGLPSNVSMDQIKRMFVGVGKCLNVYLYEYEQFDIKFINAVIKLDLESLRVDHKYDNELVVDVLQPIKTETCESEGKTVEDIVGETLTHFQTKRRNRNKSPLNQITDENILCASLDDILSSEI